MWKFRELREGQPERSPHEAEFFNVGDLDPSASIVREVIQNSLDAKLPESDSIRVRFTFAMHSASEDSKYYAGLKDHLKSCGFELDDNSYKKIPLLIVEDFGTRGLDGQINRSEIKEETKSNFYDFWWREGISKKEGREAGRWGLGKTVFHIYSKLRSFWGLTIRYDDNRMLLFGKSLLKTHRINGKLYDYSAYFTTDDSYDPIEIKESLKDFQDYFNISRTDQPGLSLVIPMIVPDITVDGILRAVILHYFFPIIRRNLIVEIDTGSSLHKLDDSSLCKYALKQNWTETPWEDRSVEDLLTFIEDAVTMPADQMLALQKSDGMLKMREDLFADKLKLSQKLYSENKLLAIRVPVMIYPSDSSPVESFFDVLIQKDDKLSKPDEFYVRSGITISEIKILKHNIRALLSADDEYVSRFLGDSESPAHTDWKERTENFQHKYKDAKPTLRFIRSSLREIAKILDTPPPGRDINFLKDIFYMEEPVEKEKGKKTKKPDIPSTERKPSIFVINKLRAGFTITLNNVERSFPFKATIRVAYDVIRGNPFSKYSPFDFDFESDALSIDLSGGTVTQAMKNKLHIMVHEGFELKVKGFDEHRDIIVDVREVME